MFRSLLEEKPPGIPERSRGGEHKHSQAGERRATFIQYIFGMFYSYSQTTPTFFEDSEATLIRQTIFSKPSRRPFDVGLWAGESREPGGTGTSVYSRSQKVGSSTTELEVMSLTPPAQTRQGDHQVGIRSLLSGKRKEKQKCPYLLVVQWREVTMAPSGGLSF